MQTVDKKGHFFESVMHLLAQNIEFETGMGKTTGSNP